MKKLLLSVCLFVFSSQDILCVIQKINTKIEEIDTHVRENKSPAACFLNSQELKIEFTNCDSQEEKELFVKSYSYFYEDIKDKMVIANMNAELEKRFNEAKILVNYNKAIAIKAFKGESLLAFAVLDKISWDSRLRVLRSAFDLKKLNEELIKQLIGFIKKSFPAEKILEAYARKESRKEKEMLEKFGFIEAKSNDPILACFEFRLSE